MNLCDTFRKQSAYTWNLLRKARTTPHQIGEETLTDLNILEMKRKHPTEVITTTFTKPREANVGADWEWWLTGPSGSWLGFRIQAKVMDLKSQNYEHLHYQKSNNDYQCDVLIKEALNATPRHIPMYCLYSNWPASLLKLQWPCQQFRPTVRAYGCTLVSAVIVKALRYQGKAKDVKSLLQHAQPWHCIFCCSTSNEYLPQRALDYWRSVMFNNEQQVFMIGPRS